MKGKQLKTRWGKQIDASMFLRNIRGRSFKERVM